MATQVISQQCFLVWERYDLHGLQEFIRIHGKIRVRVPVPRQVWPAPLIG